MVIHNSVAWQALNNNTDSEPGIGADWEIFGVSLYEPIISRNAAFNKDFGSTTDTVTEGDDSRLSDARTPISHDNTYHSETYIEATDVTYSNLNTNGDVGTTAGTLAIGDHNHDSDYLDINGTANAALTSAALTGTQATAITDNSAKISYPGSADATELNILDGATLSTIELNYVKDVTSAIQTQFTGKLSTSGTAADSTKWAGAVRYVDTVAPTGGDGADGDIWFIIET